MMQPEQHMPARLPPKPFIVVVATVSVAVYLIFAMLFGIVILAAASLATLIDRIRTDHHSRARRPSTSRW